MATFSVIFFPREFYYDSKPVYDCAADLEILNARLLGRADDLNGSFDSAAREFTDLIAWDIRSLSEEDLQNWRDAAVSVTYAASVAEMWADTVKAFHEERDAQITTWESSRTAKENAVPAKYQDDHITSTHPEVDGFWWTDWGAGDEQRCRTLYDELSAVQEELSTREQTNWQRLQDGAEEVRTMLEQGPTPENVRKLIEAGNANRAFLSLDPSRYASLIEDRELTPENAEEFAEELAAYWSGDKPLDDRYHEIMLVLSMVGTSARQNQRNGTELSDGEIEFLEEFYARLEGDLPNMRGLPNQGILAIPNLMENAGFSAEDRESALGAIGDGLLALSDTRLGGGYDMLPASVRHGVEGVYLNHGDEDKVVPLDVDAWQNWSTLSELFAHTDANLEGGYELSANLHLVTGLHLEMWGGREGDGMPSQEEMGTLLDVASRNRDANYYMLTGEHLHEEPGMESNDHYRERALEGVFTTEWHDDGHTARQLTDWLAEDLHSEDPDVSRRAGDAFAGFMETITDPDMHEALTNTGVDVTEGENEYSNASFTQFNGALADSLADIFDAHIYSFAKGDVLDGNDQPNQGIGDFDPDRSFVNMGPDERAMYMQLLMGNDETAGRVVNSVDAYQQIESLAFLETGNETISARGSGQLQGLLERALWLESENRSADLDEQIDRQKEIADFVVGEAAGLSEKIPVIGTAVSKGLDLGQESIVNAIVSGEYDVSPRFPVYTSEDSVNRNFRMETLDYLAQSDPRAFQEDTQRGDFRVLVDSGVVTVERDGRVLDASDVTNDFAFDQDVTVSVTKGDWSRFVADDLSAVDDALSNIMDTTRVNAEYVDRFGDTVQRDDSSDAWVADFTTEYMNSYGKTRDYFNGDVEGFRKPDGESEK
ncbi:MULTISPECIES: hypothetical protein [unclassified Nocardiopsis]|uniref:TPR repeat region-containing protein n=1 Tax=unclassified Nocardiopsis TaxID=2649073 RepID=UPI001359C258|nr:MULTISPECIES: hypothetical protein [unclassified Nocardiopsis]